MENWFLFMNLQSMPYAIDRTETVQTSASMYTFNKIMGSHDTAAAPSVIPSILPIRGRACETSLKL